MRKLLIGFVTLIVLAVAGILIGPSFVDWNSYKGDITAQVKSFTGRDLVIDGDIKITVLPSPAIVAKDVTFANAPGGADNPMVQLASLNIDVALGPLLGGDIQVTKVRLVDPVVVLEVLADGRQNWVFDAPESDSETLVSGDDEGSVGSDAGPALQLDNFEIVNGTVIYRDSITGMEERIEDLNSTFKAVSLSGPFESIGSMSLRGIPVSYELGVDGVFQGRTVPVSIMVRSDRAEASVIFNGNIVNLSDDAKFTGKLKAEGQSLAAIIDAVSQSGELPGGLNQAFSAEGDVTATADGVNIDALEIRLGDTSINGFVGMEIAENMSAMTEFNISHINLDKLLALTPYTGAAQLPSDTASEQSDVLSEISAVSTPAPTTSDPASIPDDISASLALEIDAITYMGEKAGPVRLNADLANGEITLSPFSAQLPGATDVTMFGFMTMQDEGPVFDGEVEMSVGDVRRLSKWMQIDLPDLPSGRFRRIEATATVMATGKNLQISGINAAFDGSRITGGVTIALRKRPAFGASLALDRIDLDGYLPVEESSTAAATAANDNDTGASETASGSDEQTSPPATNPLAVLTALTKFDANMKATVGEIIHQGISIRNIELDSTLFNGDLTLKKASVADLAGASASLGGVISELGGNPRFGEFLVKFNAKSVKKLLKLLALDLPVSAKALGKVAVTLNLDGPMLQPSLKSSVSAAGGQGTYDGRISLLPINDLIDGTVTLKHGDVAGLLRAFGIAYRPSGKIGGLNVTAQMSGDADSIKLDNLAGKLGSLKFNGTTKVRLDSDVPNVNLNIKTNAFSVDPFMPAQQNATATQEFDVLPRPVISSGAPWSDDPLDLSVLNSLDGDFRIQSDAILYESYRLENADIIANLAGGILKADRVTANLFGGRINVKGLLNAQGTPSTDATLSFENGSISNMLSSLLGEPSASGAFTFETAMKTRGSSVADMVAALDGSGSFMLKGLDVKDSVKGTAFAGILGLVHNIGQIGSGLLGQSGDGGLADASGSFVMNNGVAQIGDFRLISGMGNGSATGSIDLAGWQIDVSGHMQVAQNILGQLLVQKVGGPLELPFRVSGALDEPTVKLETASLGSGGDGGALLPGLDKLDEKIPGVGGLLQGVLGGVLGGGSTTQQQPPPQPEVQSDTQSQEMPEPQPQQQQQQSPELQNINPEDLLKEIFKF